MADFTDLVRVERVDTKCGSSKHMTVDEIRARTLGAKVDLACPECGEVHLTPEDAQEAENRRIVDSQRYQDIKQEAEEN